LVLDMVGRFVNIFKTLLFSWILEFVDIMDQIDSIFLAIWDFLKL